MSQRVQRSPARSTEFRDSGRAYALVFFLSLGLLLSPGFAFSEEVASVQVRKSAFIGEMIAVFPGMAIHGLGNLYAGERATARNLMVSEALGLAMIIVPAASAPRNSDGAIEIRGVNSYVLFGGLCVFVGGYLWDVGLRLKSWSS